MQKETCANMGYGTYNAISKLAGFLFLAVVVLGMNMAKTYPTGVFITSLLLVLLGIPICIYGLHSIQKYKDVFDFEPVSFWGKPRNGKFARQALSAFISAGIWSSLAGIALILLRP